MLSSAIEQMVLEDAIGVHGIIKVAAKALQLVRTVQIGLYFALVKSIGLLEVDAANIAALFEAIAVLNFGDLLYGLDPEVILVEAHLLLGDLLAEVYSLSRVENVFEEYALVALVENVQWRPVQEILHQVALVFLLEDVFVDAPVFQFNLQHLVVLLLLFVKFAVVPDEVYHHFEGLRVAVDEDLVLLFLQGVPTRKHRLENASFDMAQR